MAAEHQFRVLPCSEADTGTQRCRISAELIQHIGAKLGSPAWIVVSKGIRNLCTLWPRQDHHNGFIQLSDLVTLEMNDNHDTKCHRTTMTLTDLQIIEKVGAIKFIHVDVIVINFTKVQKWKNSNSKIKVAQILRKLILSPGCCVNIKQTALGKLFGLSWVLVKNFECFGTREIKCGRCVSDTNIIIDRVLSSERYQQKLMDLPCSRSLGGLSREIRLLKEIIQLTQLCAQITARFKLASGVLLHGPPGCGKTSLVYHVAKETDSYLEVINGAEVFGSRPGETEQNLKQIFKKAEVISEEGPCILFIDELDSLCPARGRGTVEQRITSMLINLIDEIISSGHVTVIGATNNAADLNAGVRRPGRLEKEILIGVPRFEQRREILKLLTANTPLHEDVDLSLLAESTPGYVSADLVSLVHQAHYAAVKEWLSLNDQNVDNETALLVRNKHFNDALYRIIPSTQRGSDILVDYKPVKWQDIGGLEEVKMKLKQTVEWPLKHPKAFSRLGLPCPRGILLYGPPGCGKTTLVRAVATSCHVTFLAINGGQLYSPYVGDSERKLMQAFQQARAGAPSILFIDEIDSVIGTRHHNDNRKSVQERVLSTLLNEMDGIGLKRDDLVRSDDRLAEGQKEAEQHEEMSKIIDNSNVLVVAATNRPDMIDDAILRPGRIDRIMYIPPPDKQARASILRIHTSRIHLDDAVLDQLAECTDCYTGADLENLCREAALFALSEDGITTNTVTYEHFLHVLETFRPSLTHSQIEQYSQMINSVQWKSS